MKEVNGLNCGREEELIAFLYGELSEIESATFQRHMRECSACGNQLHALEDVRESVVAWRNESLGYTISPDSINATRTARIDGRRRSASAALREFFSLSPLWLKGAFAFATVLFCLVAGLAVAHWRDAAPATVSTPVNGGAPSEQTLNALVEQRVKEELSRIQNGPDRAESSSVAIHSAPPRNSSRRIKLGSEVAINVSERKARRPLSSVERAQLASDLRLVSQSNDTDLDLLDDGINK